MGRFLAQPRGKKGRVDRILPLRDRRLPRRLGMGNGAVCFRFLVRGFSFSRCHGYSKAGAGAKAEASDMLLVWHLRVIN